MTDEENRSLEELQKLKLQAEINKTTAEANEIKSHAKWWTKVIIAGVVLGAAVFTWFRSTALDLSSERNELVNVRFERLQFRSDSLLAVSIELAVQKTELNNRIKAIKTLLDSYLRDRQLHLEIPTDRLREEESKVLIDRKQVKRLKAQISKLNQDITKIKSETEQLIFRTPAYFSSDAVTAFLKNKNYYDSKRNPSASGTANKFELRHGGDVVFDAATGLLWQQSGSPKVITFPQAKEYINELNNSRFSGFNDWRLPTLEESMSLMEPKSSRDKLRIELIFDKKQREIWTSTTYSPSGTWYIDFHFGYCNLNHDSDGLNFYYVRAVR